MKREGEGEWFEGSDTQSFAAAARRAVEHAEEVLGGRGEDLPTLYDVRLQVTAEGPLSGYKVFVSPTG
jgi:hypothetical protein